MTTTGRCPYCWRPGTGEPCNPTCASQPARGAHDHQLAQAHSPTPATSGLHVYVVCGWQGCAHRLQVDAAAWEAELARRAALADGVQVWHARGDRLVPVAPDVDGLMPGGTRPPDGDDRDAVPGA